MSHYIALSFLIMYRGQVSNEAIRDRDRIQQMKYGLNQISYSACLTLVSQIREGIRSQNGKGIPMTEITGFWLHQEEEQLFSLNPWTKDCKKTRELKLALTLLLAILLGLASCCRRILQSKALRSLSQFTKAFYQQDKFMVELQRGLSWWSSD